MKLSLTSAAVAALGSAISAHAAATPPSAQTDLAWAYAYAYPLYAYGNVAKPLHEGVKPNMLLHSRGLNTPGGVGVVRPNADTLYSVVMFDLSSVDLKITIPEMPLDRFWVYPIVTPYGDHLVNLGIINETPAGDYLLTYSADGSYGLDMENVPGNYTGVIKYPMAYGISDMRILANRTEEDVATVRELQKGFKVRPIPRLGQDPIAPALDLAMFNETQYNDGHDQGDGFFQDVLRVAAKLEPYCPTYVVEDREMVQRRLKNAGFNGEKWTKPPATNLTGAVDMANKTSIAATIKNSHDVGNNWIIIDEEYFGLFNSHYDTRYAVASFVYLGLTAEQALYPSNTQSLDLEDGQAVLFTFTEPPRVSEKGFWSLTVYGPNQDLVENELGRYSIGSQDSITFPDGTPVTAHSCPKKFQILLQAENLEPPEEWISNWLPLSAGGGTFSVTLRWYGADEYMSDGSYVHPKVEIIEPITE